MLKLMILAAIFYTLLTLISPTTRGDLDNPWVYPPIPCSADVCTVTFSPGGIVDLFAAEGREIAKEGKRVIIDGPCMSACTIFLDKTRDTACVTDKAILGYHQGYFTKEDGTQINEVIKYDTPGLNEYIKSHGGEPTQDSGHLLMLNYSEASQFYKECK